MALFSNKQEANLRSCVQMIEDVIRSLGHSPEETRIEPAGAMPAWRMRNGSALVTVALAPGGDDVLQENILQVSAPVLILDVNVNRLALFRHLLELNATAVRGMAFGLERDHVVLVGERSTVDLDLSEVHELVQKVEDYADHYDDALVAEFGGQRAGDADPSALNR